MSVQVETLEKSMAKLTIEVSAEEFETALDKAYKKNKSKISLPGFRKGKAPRAMIEKMYGAGVFYEDAANDLIPGAYESAAKESELEIVAQPSIDVTQIEVTFDIDANGIVNVSAKDLGTGKEQHITITAGSNMSDSDIEKAVKEAAEFEAQDKKRKEAIEARNEADSFVFQTEKALNEVGDKVPESDKTQVQADLEAVKAILERTKDQEMSDSDVDELKAAKEKLTQSAQSVFTKMYEQAAQAQQGAQGAAGPDMNAQAGSSNAGSSADDDVIDGDFREV